LKKNKKSKKNRYTSSLTTEERKIYKNRIHIEHTFSHVKQSKLIRINVRTKDMLINKIYSRFIDLQVIRNIKLE
jgi:hypothetical protein